MINLLPPDVKQAMRYGRYNVRALTYLWIVLATLGLLAAAFGGLWYYLGLQQRQLALSVADQQAQIASYASFQLEAKAAATRLNSIKAIVASQTRFSVLLADLAKVIPQEVVIDSITLTGDDKKPLRISITASSYETALAFRDAIIASPRIAGADLESVAKQPERGSYSASISFGFSPGQAR